MKVPTKFSRVAIAAGAVLVLGGSAVGIAAAQQATPTPTPTTYQKFIDALAAHFGISSQEMQKDISDARQAAGLPTNGGFPGPRGPRGFGFGFDFKAAADAIGISPQQLRTDLAGKSLAQVAQANGKSPTDVANALKTAAHTQIDNHIDQLMNRVVPAGTGQNGQGDNGEGPRGGRGPGEFGHGLVQQGLNVAADAIGITPQQLRTELPGKSLAQVAQANGKSPTDVANALKTAAHTQIDNHIDQLMNQVLPQRGPRGANGNTGPSGDQQQDGATG